MLNLARLNILREVVQRASFSSAAEALDYTQSAVSQAVARLEAETGASLVVRDRRGGRATVAGATLFPQAVAAFRHLHPDVELSLGEGEPEEVAPRLRAGEFDLALLFEFPGEEQHFRGLAKTPLIHDPMWVALPVEHQLARKHNLALIDLRDQDWVQTSAQSACARHVISG